MNNQIIYHEGKPCIKCSAVMLHSKGLFSTPIFIGLEEFPEDFIYNPPSNMDIIFSDVKYQHLYITSDEEINEGDWVFNEDYGIGKVKDTSDYGKANAHLLTVDGYHWHFSGSKKIIATTDPKLQNFHVHEGSGKYWENQPITRKSILGKPIIPQPSQDFIKEYCDKGGIDEVLVEINIDHIMEESSGDTSYYEIKTDQNNTITIHPIKTSWNKDEVLELLEKFKRDMDKPEYTTQCIDGNFTIQRIFKMKKWLDDHVT